jgi:hypothetical protein
LAGLYYPESPYEFSVLPAEILGNVYEQFLGKVIRLTPAHQAKVEPKKAYGVYYTPAYIVEYIVKNTLGKLTEGKSPKQLRGVRVLDPACGSGSFLLGAYQFLLDYYLAWYAANKPEKHAAEVRPLPSPSGGGAGGGGGGGGWRLTTAEKKRILTEHLYGVDLDRQAVEVTKLSLLLKVLEGENDESLGKQLALFHERALPNLDANIKCGNSLIGPDYFSSQMFADPEELRRVNPFDWTAEFPLVFTGRKLPLTPNPSPSGRGESESPSPSGRGDRGEGESHSGFDCVIGNPPYIRIQTLQETSPAQVTYLKQQYSAASAGNYDIYVVFVEKGLSLLNKRGRLGFILPHKFFNAQYGEALRRLIANGRHLGDVVHFGDQQVFDGATTYTALMFLDKRGNDSFELVRVNDLKAWRAGVLQTHGEVQAQTVTAAEWNFAVGKGAALFERLSQMPVKLGDVAKRIFQGFKTGADPVFIVEKRDSRKFYSNALDSEISIETKYLRPLYKSGEMKRYNLRENSRFVIFPYRNGSLIDWNEIVTKAPKTAEYLKLCREALAKRENGRWNDSHWYCYSRNQALEIISSSKILTADLNPSANYCFDKSGEACFPGGAAGGYGIVLEEDMYLYVLGLLNSKAVDYYHKQISTNFRGGWFGYDAKVIRNIPIRSINFSDKQDKARHDKMVKLVEQMLDLQKQLAGAKDDWEAERLQRVISATDKQIDSLVYELYGLIPEEIAIVEGRAA